MGSFLIGLLGQIAGLIGGSIGGAISMVTGLVKTGYSQVLQYNKEGIALARQMGLNANEAQAYTSTLINRAKELGKAYGLAAEQVIELQKNITSATGKQLMLNDVEAERMVQINNLVGSEVFNQFTSEMMNGMGAQLSTVQGAVSKAYSTAAKSGLNAQKISEKIANNLSMANKLSFRNGIDGLTKMAIQAEKVGLNLQSVETAAGQFMDLDKAIQNSAQMQMLGGSAAAMFGNPLTASYEANYDPEAFGKRLSDSLASYATFDAKSGVAKVNGMNMDFVRNIASAMGMSVDDAVKSAKKQSEVRYKEGAFGSALGQYTQEQRDFILNKSYVENGRLMINDTSGGKHDITSGKLDTAILNELTKFNGQSDRDIMETQAKSLISIDDTIQGYETSFFATIAERINDFAPEIKNIVKYIGDFATSEIAPKIGDGITEIGSWLKTNGSEIKNIADKIANAISSTVQFFKDHSGWLKVTLGTIAAAIVAKSAVSFVRSTKELGTSIASVFKRGGGSPLEAVSNGGGGNAAMASRGGISSIANKAKNLAKFGKVAKIGGAAIGVGLGAFNAISANENYADRRKELYSQLKEGAISKTEYDKQVNEARQEKNANVGEGMGTALGAAIGTVIGGPIGTAIGGWLGGVGGKLIGENWEEIKGYAESAWDSTKEYASSAWNGITDWFNSAWDTTVGTIKKSWDGVVGAFSSVGQWIKRGWNTVTKWFTSVNWGEIGKIIISIISPPIGLIIKTIQHWDEITDWFKGAWDTTIGVVKDSWNGAVSAVASITNFFKDTWSGTVNSFNSITDWLKGKWDGIVNAFNGTADWFKSAWGKVTSFFTNIGEGIAKAWDTVCEVLGALNPVEWAKKAFSGVKNAAKSVIAYATESHAEGGVIGGSSYNGDRVLTRLNSGEMVLNQNQQSNAYNHYFNTTNAVSSINASQQGDLFKAFNTSKGVSSLMPSTITSVLSNNNDVMAKPVGEKEYIYTPTRSETSNINGNTVTVKDFNINLSGTIKLDGGNNSKNVDVNALLNDYQFINNLKEMIKTSINNDMNGGRYMNDLATMRGHTTSSSIIR